jgi:hypothetical protein
MKKKLEWAPAYIPQKVFCKTCTAKLSKKLKKLGLKASEEYLCREWW